MRTENTSTRNLLGCWLYNKDPYIERVGVMYAAAGSPEFVRREVLRRWTTSN